MNLFIHPYSAAHENDNLVALAEKGKPVCVHAGHAAESPLIYACVMQQCTILVTVCDTCLTR